MSQSETAGVAALGRILARLSKGEPLSVVELVTSEGLARSTAFAVVKRMEAVQLVAKRQDGSLVPGPAAGEFAYAAFGLAPLHGRAEALLGWLRDETNAGVELRGFDGRTYLPLVMLSISTKGLVKGDELAFAVRRGGAQVAQLLLHPSSASLGVDNCASLALQAVAQLESYLAENTI